jgi:cytochrome c553
MRVDLVFRKMVLYAVGTSLGLLYGHSSVDAGDAKAGRAKVEDVCAVCHGSDGLSKVPEAPGLAGQNETYMIEQLGLFKTGARSNDMMTGIAKDLSDGDIANVAAYYAAIPVTVGKPPE